MAAHRIFTTSFADVYPHYVAKAEKKGRQQSEVNTIICWLTGYSKRQLKAQLEQQKTFQSFFDEAPNLNPARTQIKGLICGVRIEEIEEPLMREIRYLDKLVDDMVKDAHSRVPVYRETLDDVVGIFEELTGRPRPRLRLPAGLMAGIAEVVSPIMSHVFPKAPQRLTPGAIHILRKYRHADCSKAKRELGYVPTSVREAFAEAHEDFVRRGLLPARVSATRMRRAAS